MGVERPCLICGSESNEESGWLKNQDDLADERVWWLCQRCLDLDDFAIDWRGHFPLARHRFPPRRLHAWYPPEDPSG